MLTYGDEDDVGDDDNDDDDDDEVNGGDLGDERWSIGSVIFLDGRHKTSEWAEEYELIKVIFDIFLMLCGVLRSHHIEYCEWMDTFK